MIKEDVEKLTEEVSKIVDADCRMNLRTAARLKVKALFDAVLESQLIEISRWEKALEAQKKQLDYWKEKALESK